MASSLAMKQELADISKQLRSIERRLTRIEKNQRSEMRDEETLLEAEEKEFDEMKRLEELEREILSDVSPKPLARITYHDITKGIIGAFFGIVGHFAFFYGSRIAETINLLRAHALLITSLIILILFLYFSGFRKTKKEHHYVAWRVVTIYGVAHAIIICVLFLFGIINFDMSFIEIYKNVAAVSIIAVMGAATADLIGGE